MKTVNLDGTTIDLDTQHAYAVITLEGVGEVFTAVRGSASELTALAGELMRFVGAQVGPDILDRLLAVLGAYAHRPYDDEAD